MSEAGRASSPQKTQARSLQSPYDAVLFDLDSVLTDTNGFHAADLVGRLREGRVPLAFVTAHRNARPSLRAAGLGDAFDEVVDGSFLEGLGPSAWPHPGAFLEAVSRLGVAPARAAVISDASAGISCARRTGFGLVVGFDRANRRAELERAGADLIVENLSELDFGLRRSNPWILVYEGFDPSHETHREALTTLGNGYMATRGALPEHSDDGIHYPGTYLAGIYNRLESTVDGKGRVDEEIVNAPNWLPVDIAVDDGAWWSEDGLTVSDERRELDLRRGILTRSVKLVDRDQHVIHVTQRRLVSMERSHVAALQTTLVLEGWDGRLRIRAGLDTRVVNGNAVESRLLANRHLAPLAVEYAGGVLVVEVETTQSRIRIAAAARTRLLGRNAQPVWDNQVEGCPMQKFDVEMADGQPIVLEKVVALVTSRDAAISAPRDGALAELERVEDGFDRLAQRHMIAWQQLWEHFAVEVDTNEPIQLALHLYMFQVLQALTPHTSALDAGIPARGLHGEGYRGHVFWDELFVLPLFVMRTPGVARSLLDYRWRRLDAARWAATKAGYRGAMFPWQSGSEGRDETPHSLFNPRSRRWVPDYSWRQRHVGLAIAYNVWQYYQATTDTVWFAERGAELIVEITRFFSALARYSEEDRQFHIEGVMGPDEYHDGYPGRPGLGLRDNAYTNVMTAWICQRAVDTLSMLPPHEGRELRQKLRLRPSELQRWRDLAKRMAVPFHDGVISQFAGYQDLAELDWDAYRHAYGNIQRLDLILEAEGDSPNHYRLSKQADVLMLVYLLGPDELLGVLENLGYDVTLGELAATADYYLARTAHGSTLSRVVHTSVLAMLDRSVAWSEFREALDADLDDTQGGTTGHGIHLAAMAGTVDIVVRTFAGVRMQAERLVFRPRLPGALRKLSFQLRYHGRLVTVRLGQSSLRLEPQPDRGPPIQVVVDGTKALLKNKPLDFPIHAPRFD